MAAKMGEHVEILGLRVKDPRSREELGARFKVSG